MIAVTHQQNRLYYYKVFKEKGEDFINILSPYLPLKCTKGLAVYQAGFKSQLVLTRWELEGVPLMERVKTWVMST